MINQSRSGIVAIFAIFVFLIIQCPVSAEVCSDPALPDTTINSKSVSDAPTDKNTKLIAQTSTAAEVADVAAASTVTGKKQKNELLITDSLWGNLILEMAYERDPQIRKLLKHLSLVNMGTMAAIASIAGGTVAQGVIALATLNPQPGYNDNYLPGAIGIGMSGLTIIAFLSRAIINHHIAKSMRNRQLEIKHRVEAVLANLEKENGQDSDSKRELVDLVGERAANEWLQLWHSSNSVASLKIHQISLTPSTLIVGNNP